MNSYQQKFNQEVLEPISVSNKIWKLSNDLMKIEENNTINNKELYMDIQKICNVLSRNSSCELVETNGYLTDKYKCFIENSNGGLRLVKGEMVHCLTDEEHIIVLVIYARLLYESIQNNDFNTSMSKLNQTIYTAAEHIGESALKAWLK